MSDPSPAEGGAQAAGKAAEAAETKTKSSDLRYVCYGHEKESPYLPLIKQLISRDLSEPYSIYVYRYFLYQWGDLCFMVNFVKRLSMARSIG